MLSDRQLLDEYAASGTEGSFGELVRRHINLVYSTALRRAGGNTHLAQDVVQLVFTDLARKAGGLPKNVLLAGWLHRATRFAAAQAARSESRRRHREQEAVAMNITDSSLELDWTAIRPLLDEALDGLQATDRDALLLRFFEEREIADVARALGLSEPATRKRVERALEKLRTGLLRRGVTTTVASLSATVVAHAMVAAPAGMAATVASASLAGVTAVPIAAFTLLKLFTMTKLQTGISVAVATGLAFTLVVEHKAQARLREENRSLISERDRLAKMAAELETNHLAITVDSKPLATEQFNELLRLRGEVAKLRMTKAESSTDNSYIKDALAWKARAAQLKQRMEQSLHESIPELRLLTERDWFDVGRDANLDTEIGYRIAFSELRNGARNRFASEIADALTKYTAASSGQLPNDIAELKNFFTTPPDDDMLQQYQVVKSGKASELPDKESCWVVKEKMPLDDGFDMSYHIGVNCYGIVTSAGQEDLAKAVKSYAEANKGEQPSQPSQLQEYVKSEAGRTALERLSRSVTGN